MQNTQTRVKETGSFLASLVALLVLLMVGIAPAVAGGHASKDKVTICHATGSKKNPYVKQTVSTKAFFTAGHIDHAGDIWPEFTYTEPGRYGRSVTIPAQGDQEIWANGCKVPPVEPEEPEEPEVPEEPVVPEEPEVPPVEEPEIPEQPEPGVYSDGEWDLSCARVLTTVTRTVTTPYVWDGNDWVLDDTPSDVHMESSQRTVSVEEALALDPDFDTRCAVDEPEVKTPHQVEFEKANPDAVYSPVENG